MFSSQIFVSLQLYAPVVLISYFGNNLMAGQYRIVEQIIVIFKTYIFLFFNYVFPKSLLFNRNRFPKKIKNWVNLQWRTNFVFVTVWNAIFYFYSYEIVSPILIPQIDMF